MTVSYEYAEFIHIHSVYSIQKNQKKPKYVQSSKVLYFLSIVH